MKIRDRIKELRRVPASELLPNPKNWRHHPDQQSNALRGILAEVGIAGAVLAYETDAGLMLVDGHLRAEITTDQDIPVLVLDVTDDEADKLLATYDVVTEFAQGDDVALAELVGQIDIKSQQLAQVLSDYLEELNSEPPDFEPVGEDDQQSQLDEKSPMVCPECGHVFPKS